LSAQGVALKYYVDVSYYKTARVTKRGEGPGTRRREPTRRFDISTTTTTTNATNNDNNKSTTTAIAIGSNKQQQMCTYTFHSWMYGLLPTIRIPTTTHCKHSGAPLSRKLTGGGHSLPRGEGPGQEVGALEHDDTGPALGAGDGIKANHHDVLWSGRRKQLAVGNHAPGHAGGLRARCRTATATGVVCGAHARTHKWHMHSNLVLRDTLCSCEAYGNETYDKEKIVARAVTHTRHPHTPQGAYTHVHMSHRGGGGKSRPWEGGEESGTDSALSTTGNIKARAMTKSPSAGRDTHPPPPTNRSAAHTGSRVALWLQTSCPWSTHTWGPRGRSTPPGTRGGGYQGAQRSMGCIAMCSCCLQCWCQRWVGMHEGANELIATTRTPATPARPWCPIPSHKVPFPQPRHTQQVPVHHTHAQ
jgi:hypothetical protein